MDVSELKKTVEEYRDKLKESGGHAILSGPSGPVGMSVIDNVVSTLEAMDDRIKALESE